MTGSAPMKAWGWVRCWLGWHRQDGTLTATDGRRGYWCLQSERCRGRVHHSEGVSFSTGPRHPRSFFTDAKQKEARK